VIVSGIVHVSMGSAVHDWSLLIREETGASTAIGCLIISLILLKTVCKVSTCVISQSDHPFNSYHQNSRKKLAPIILQGDPS